MTDTAFSTLTKRLQLPAIGAPMFLISNPDLVIAQCKAGIIGTFPALNARPSSMLAEWLERINDELAAHDKANPDNPSAPFAVNLIVHKSNPRLEEDLELCVKHRVPVVVTSLGAREDVNSRVKGYGGIVLHDVINNRFAHKAIEKGASGLIAVAAGAGGHAGVTSPFALIREIREWFDGPLALSGAISHGASILAALACGADLAYMGSVFIATHEANAAEAYKQMILDSSAKDILYTNQFTGVHGNYLIPSIIAAGLDPDNLPGSNPSAMDFGDNDASDAKAWRDIWGAGQGIGIIHEKASTADVVSRLKAEFITAKQRLT
ncbi:NAD(P)H-dependent flavin oxidoreductase [Emcibacter nanhaiensis]|uniref:Nitronate monooxygenase n=1 Tax=Emcibacter nanhaiensis TaxID=1505037 RepID=A0A501PIM4_9PROT|nr:nitronate monooxygenase family protein [Emcibacter nanhaiensis]TPD59872.1 nitronate monooxygenase [Emcibacter nanhaiensis]